MCVCVCVPKQKHSHPVVGVHSWYTVSSFLCVGVCIKTRPTKHHWVMTPVAQWRCHGDECKTPAWVWVSGPRCPRCGCQCGNACPSSLLPPRPRLTQKHSRIFTRKQSWGGCRLTRFTHNAFSLKGWTFQAGFWGKARSLIWLVGSWNLSRKLNMRLWTHAAVVSVCLCVWLCACDALSVL